MSPPTSNSMHVLSQVNIWLDEEYKKGNVLWRGFINCLRRSAQRRWGR